MLEYLRLIFRADYLIALTCSSIIFYPVYKKYANTYKSLISYEQKIYILVLEFIILLASLKNLVLSEIIVAVINMTIYSIYYRTYRGSIVENRKLRKNVKAYARYMRKNWEIPVKLGRIIEDSEEGREIYSSLLTFDEFVKREDK